MRPAPDAWTIVVLGRWNIGIFTPQWLSRHVFGVDEIQVEFPIFPGLPPRFQANLVRMLPDPARVLVTPTEQTPAGLAAAEKCMVKLLETLRHTPVSAVGINFGFTEADADDELLARFPDPNSTAFADEGCRIERRTATWRVKRDEQVVNVTAAIESPNIQFQVNFHTDVADADRAKAVIEGRAASRLAFAKQLLTTVFHIAED